MAYEHVLVALADPTRRAILEALREGPRSVSDIADGLPVSRPAVSQHLAVLLEARLVSQERDGTRRMYEANAAGLEELRRYLEGFWGQGLAAFAAAAVKAAAVPNAESGSTSKSTSTSTSRRGKPRPVPSSKTRGKRRIS